MPVVGPWFLSRFEKQNNLYGPESIAVDKPAYSNIPNKAQEVYIKNQPIGKGKGIFPGRVVWAWDPKATNPKCTNTTNGNGIHDHNDDAWFMDKNTSQEKVDRMLSKGILSISGKENSADAWNAIFRHHNMKRGKGEVDYQEGEKVLIKLNRTSGSMSDQKNGIRSDKEGTLCSETSPHLVLSVLRQLVYKAKIPQKAIYLGDPQRKIFKDEYEKYHAEFPHINYISNTSGKGKYHLTPSQNPLIFYSDHKKVMPEAGSDKLYNIMQDAEYLINLPAMKGHGLSGITLFAKNHFGSLTTRSSQHLHPGLTRNRKKKQAYGIYRVLVDFMGNKHTGGKNLIYILDALWSGADWNGYPVKFHMPPFDNHWNSSLFVSMDPVAIESVAFDFLRTEFSRPEHDIKYIYKPGTDDYLHQAADSGNRPEDLSYQPDGDGLYMADSLGVHEHWNDPIEKKYSRNKGLDEGIELINVHL